MSSFGDNDQLLNIGATLRRHRFLVATFTLCALLASGVVAFSLPRLYEARSMVMLQTLGSETLSAREFLQFYTRPIDESIILSEVEVLRSRDLVEAVVDNLDLMNDAEFWDGLEKPTDPIALRERTVQHVINGLDIRPVGRSLVIEARFKHLRPNVTARVLNRFIEVYQEQQVRNKALAAHKTALWLRERLKTLSQKVQQSAKAVEDYRVQQNLISTGQMELTAQQIHDLSKQFIVAQSDLAAAMARNENANALARDDKTDLDATATAVENTHMLSLLRRHEVVITKEYADLRSRYGPNHPRILAVKAEMDQLQARKKEASHKAVHRLGNDVAVAEARLGTLQKSLETLEEKRRAENRAAIGLRELEREAEADRAIYETFLTRYKEAAILGEVQQPDTKIISTARVPTVPTGHSRILVILLATITGFILGLFAAVILEQIENANKNPNFQVIISK